MCEKRLQAKREGEERGRRGLREERQKREGALSS
jgi:hypothetical protein